MSWLIGAWYKKNLFSYLLMPLSAIYLVIIYFRYLLFRFNFKKSHAFAVPVIVVGNITVGGTGKTPLVIWLANFLQQQGFQPGIVSRGYGGKATEYPQQVTNNSIVEIVGDEAILIAEKTQCPMFVAPQRIAAVQALLNKTSCNVVISDDGLQHYALARNIEIAVLDGQRRFGNGLCLPAGPLREPVSRLQKVDFIVANGKNKKNEYAMQLLPKTIYNIAQNSNLLDPNNVTQSVHAVAGIGNPERFFTTLKMLGFKIIEHVFPDHHIYKEQDFDFAKDDIIIMTEKDALKCRSFADQRFWCLPVVAELDQGFIEDFRNKLINLKK